MIHGFLALALGLLLFPQEGRGFQFDVFPGFDGHTREAHWYPVTFEIRNDGPPVLGFIELSASQFGREHARRVPIELPTGTLKRVTVPVFSASRHPAWQARFVTEQGKVLARQEITAKQIKQVSSDTVLMGALSRSASGAPSFPAMKRNQPETQPMVAKLQPPIFPDNPIALDGLRILYLNSERALDLSSSQTLALLAWLQTGGHLIVGVEQITDVNGNPWLRDLLPCQFSSARQIKAGAALQQWISGEDAEKEDAGLPSLRVGTSQKKTAGAAVKLEKPPVPDESFDAAEMLVAVGQVRDGTVTISADGLPLIMEARRGLGRITVLAFSPERAPFINWKNRAWFWAAMSGLPFHLFETSDFRQPGGWSADGLFGAMIETSQIRKLPLAWLVLLLVGYLLIIGPLDQYWLKRINRQMLTWVTFPLYVAGFSVLIYLIGFKLRAGDSEWNELHLVDVIPSGERTVNRGRTFATIYSPSNHRYPLEGSQTVAALRGEFLSSWGSSSEHNQSSVIQRGNNFVAEVFVPVWTSQLYVNDWLETSQPAPLEVAVAEGNSFRVTVRNKLKAPLAEARLYVRGKIYQLGSVPGGQAREFKVDDKEGVAVPAFVKKHSSQFFPVVP